MDATCMGYVYLEPVSLSSILRVVCFTLRMKAQTPSIQNKGSSHVAMWVPGFYIVHLQVLQEDLQSLQ